jgi:NAD(P)H dehydrogenase (quinone)
VTIGVTGATGGVGSRVIRHLLDQADGVIALARRPDAVPAAPRLTSRFADYDDPVSLRAAFSDLHTLVFVSSDGVTETMLRHHEHVVAAAVNAGVEHVVYMSIVDVSPQSGFYYSAIHRETEELLGESGLELCLARTSIFTDYFVSTWLAPALADGVLALPAGDGRMSLVTREDTARALADAALSRCHGIVELTGPDALTGDEICRITEAVRRRPLRYLPVEGDEYSRRLAGEAAPAWLIEAFTSLFASVEAGRFAGVSADGPRLTGRPHEPYAEFIRRTAFPEA